MSFVVVCLFLSCFSRRLKLQVGELEQRLLDELADSEGNILENKGLISSLNQTKSQSSQISAALEHAKVIQVPLRSAVVISCSLHLLFPFSYDDEVCVHERMT